MTLEVFNFLDGEIPQMIGFFYSPKKTFKNYNQQTTTS